MYEIVPGRRAGACADFVCEVDDENNGISPGFMAHRFRAKVEIVGVASHIWCKTFHLPHDSLNFLFIGKCKWCGLALI